MLAMGRLKLQSLMDIKIHYRKNYEEMVLCELSFPQHVFDNSFAYFSVSYELSGQSTPSPVPNSSGSSGFSDDDSLPFDDRTGLTLAEFVEHLKQKGRRGLLDEYAEIISKTPDGTFDISR